MTIVLVSSVIANKYLNGGNAWVVLNWVLGFEKLGFRTYFIEQISREHCIDAAGRLAAFEDSENLAYFRRVAEQFGLSKQFTLIYEDGEQIEGLTRAELFDLTDAAELLINVTGHLKLEPLKSHIRRKAYIDLDPGFTQFWHVQGNAGPRLDGHDFYFTIGENIGSRYCSIPTGGICWLPIRQPVVLEYWPTSIESTLDRFTTVASWRGPFGPIRCGEKVYELKVHQFRKFIEMPERARQTFEIALDIHPADVKDLNLLCQHGWKIVDPKDVAHDPESFRCYVQGAGAEFSVAQGIYVETNSGWFSDRTVCYLASGKPALVQDTGFSRNYPVSEGLLAFRTLDEAVANAGRIARDYDVHCRAARAIAEEYFDSDKVLGRLIEEVGVAP
jgi:hypothetical protein